MHVKTKPQDEDSDIAASERAEIFVEVEGKQQKTKKQKKKN